MTEREIQILAVGFKHAIDALYHSTIEAALPEDEWLEIREQLWEGTPVTTKNRAVRSNFTAFCQDAGLDPEEIEEAKQELFDNPEW